MFQFFCHPRDYQLLTYVTKIGGATHGGTNEASGKMIIARSTPVERPLAGGRKLQGLNKSLPIVLRLSRSYKDFKHFKQQGH